MEISVLDWLNKTVVKYKDKIIFSDENNSVTFEQFDFYTKSIGSFLALKIKPGSPVAAMLGRNIMTPACFLGIVRAGCFYAPMDAAMPVSRLNQIIDVVKSEYLIVDRENLKIAEKIDFNGEIIILDDIINSEINESLLCCAVENMTDQSPLYVIFTSGSSGVPKGVITSHHSLMSYIDAVGDVLKIDDSDVMGNQSPLDYIAAVRDIYLPVSRGCSTVIIPKNIFSMPENLMECLNNNRVTTLCWSTAGVEVLPKISAFEVGKPEYLRKVCFSGSVINNKYLRVWQDELPDVQFINQYGPTEATASCTYYIIDKKVEENTVIPIGRSYRNYSVILLNEDGLETQIGDIGEICILGPSLALGYYGNPEKTAESFIQNPCNPYYRELIYKTGDLGRYGEDGLLYFHGRKDRQIKHMGHRIELGEIEITAQQIDGVENCCALYQKEKELLYLFYTGGASSKDIVIYFRKMLPAFMVPRKLVQMDELPTLPNGKYDLQSMKKYFK